MGLNHEFNGLLDLGELDYTLQSSAVDMVAPKTTQKGSGEDKEQTVTFSDNNQGTIVDLSTVIPSLLSDNPEILRLNDYFSRPVKIDSFSVSLSTPVARSIFPWTLFFSNAIIGRKLDNYFGIRCNLHIKVVVNSTPFVYGALRASYRALPLFDTAPIAAGDELILESQRPGIWIYPQSNQGGEMVLPFLWQRNWLNATRLTDFDDMGEFIFRSYIDTQTANGAVGINTDVVTYAWASDVELLGTTDELSLQSTPQTDEYAMNGVISRPASSVAKVASTLSEVPVIGPFATATSMAATGIGKAAALLGYSKSKDVSDIHYVKPSALPNLAAPDLPESIDKLTLDAKNELSIDPRVAGCSPDDPMNLSAFAAREGVFTTISWAETDATGADLINWGVNPCMAKSAAITAASRYAMLPSCFAAQCFQYWRGDMIYRIKVIASQYHRGRIQVSWDPRKPSFGIATDISASVYNTIMDIGESTELEFRVPMSQTVPYLQNIYPPSTIFSTSTSIFSSSTNIVYNGYITVKVLTELSSPSGSAPASIIFSARAGDNIEFAGPVEPDYRMSPYTPQSVEMDYDMNGEIDIAGGSTRTDPNLSSVYMGEKVPSIRTLCQRTCVYATIPFEPPSATTNACLSTWVHHRLPLYPGFDPVGSSAAVGLISGVSQDYNWVCWNYMNWFAMCYVGQRGAINYYFMPNSQGDYMPQIIANRAGTAEVSYTLEGLRTAQGATRNSINWMVNRLFQSCRGTAVSHSTSNATLSLSLPLYSNYKFISNSTATRTRGTNRTIDNTFMDGFEVHAFQPIGSSNQPVMQVFTSAGPDFSFVYFQNVPTIYRYSADPIPS